jgi:hypothetical protein
LVLCTFSCVLTSEESPSCIRIGVSDHATGSQSYWHVVRIGHRFAMRCVESSPPRLRHGAFAFVTNPKSGNGSSTVVLGDGQGKGPYRPVRRAGASPNDQGPAFAIQAGRSSVSEPDVRCQLAVLAWRARGVGCPGVPCHLSAAANAVVEIGAAPSRLRGRLTPASTLDFRLPWPSRLVEIEVA